MKKIITLFAIVGLVAFSSCEGPEGPPGPPGYDGYDGLVGIVYENPSNKPYDFTLQNNFQVRFIFPKSIVESDVVLVYRLGGVDPNRGKAIWEFLPQTFYKDNDSRDFSFNFNFTYDYVNIFLSGTDLGTVSPAYRLGQTFRIVVVPADFAASVNKSSYSDVVSKLNIKESQIQEISF
ncbi:hypothetical protein [Flavobacterium hydatis]|jgi:hypothetical protein|uniref:Dihydrolipoamide dehydrogenase n=1 Tax=Flavobacterium hydatis TaxID=991 RepID=A0ABX4BZI9_FLAHY|nr:hypothetical protein [Flavobacterium hydatis]OXA84918.1 hypothetical protein B0A62_24765 [Flavobacterium hydatis]